MATRSARLERLVRLQAQLTALHEMRLAGHMRDAAEAQGTAAEIGARKEAGDSLSGLFPDVYERGIVRALASRDAALAEASKASARLAEEQARAQRLEEDFRDALRLEERAEAEKATLESVERALRRNR